MLVYLDNAATTRVDEEVLQEMLPFMKETYANPSGACSFAARARSAVEKAREQAARLIGAENDEIVFTSGGTEADNMAVLGTAQSCRMAGNGRDRIITGATEHPAVLESCREAARRGFRVSYAPCDETGKTDTEFIRANADSATALISLMTANNELGTVQPVREAALIAHEAGALFHTDAVQAAGHIPVNVRECGNIDLLSISAHKLHGPKGIGALYIKRGTRILPVGFGGGQEKGLRSGTLNVPAIVGFGKACEIAASEMDKTVSDMLRKREYFTGKLQNNIEGIHINGVPDNGSDMTGSGMTGSGMTGSGTINVLPGIVSVSFDGIEGSSLLIELDMRGICCSTGSACSSSGKEPSHVLTAAGLSEERIKGAMRFSFSKYTTFEELDLAVKAAAECAARLREMRCQ